MAHSKISLAFLALTLFLVATPHSSHGLNISDDPNLARVQVLGVLYCTSTGNPDPACGGLNCPPLIGVPVAISCGNSRTTLGQAVTNTSGAYMAVFNTADSLLFDPSLCAAYVNLPVLACAALPPTGTLRATFEPVGIVSGAVSGGVGVIEKLVSKTFAFVG